MIRAGQPVVYPGVTVFLYGDFSPLPGESLVCSRA